MLLLCTISLLPSLILAQVATLPCQLGAGAVAAATKDWFLVYKFPGTTDNNDISKYLASDQNTFTPSQLILNGDAPLRKTLQAYAPGGASKAVVVYTNFPPYVGAALPLSPPKGIVLMADGLGSWIIHSFPKFVDMTQQQIAYTPQNPAGLAVCLTMKNTDIPNIFTSLIYTDAVPYYSATGGGVTAYTNLNTENFINGVLPTVTPYFESTQLQTNAAMSIRAFAKLTMARVDIYSRYINVALKTGLRVRFNDGASAVLSNVCTLPYKVENIGGSITVSGTVVTAAQDEGVWAITNSTTTPLFCISDSPRTQKQLNLGSSVVCIAQDTVVKEFSAIAGTSTSRKCA